MKIDTLSGVVEFDWNEANITHITNHNVTPEEAEEIFSDKTLLSLIPLAAVKVTREATGKNSRAYWNDLMNQKLNLLMKIKKIL